jgi:hypothetical protein
MTRTRMAVSIRGIYTVRHISEMSYDKFMPYYTIHLICSVVRQKYDWSCFCVSCRTTPNCCAVHTYGTKLPYGTKLSYGTKFMFRVNRP